MGEGKEVLSEQTNLALDACTGDWSFYLQSDEVVEQICLAVDAAFEKDDALARRFSAAPAARGERCSSQIRFVRDRPGHDMRYAIDPTRLETELGFEAKVEFAAGLEDTVRWYLDNESWWRAVMDGSYRTWVDRHYGA